LNKPLLFIALRYFKPKYKQKDKAGSCLAIIGMAIGIMSLIATLAVMNGLQQGFISAMLEIGSSHIVIRSRGFLSNEQLNELRALPAVRSVVAEAELQTLIRSSFNDHQIVSVKANSQEIFDDTEFFNRLNITAGYFPTQEGTILLGSELAFSLGVGLNDDVYLLTLPAGSLTAHEQPLTVVGIFQSNFFAYDSTLAFISLEEGLANFIAVNEIYYRLKIINPYRDRPLVASLIAQGYEAESWREYNRAFFAALRLEKNVMFLLLSLIFVVVAVNIFQLRRREIEEKAEQIAILRALGLNAHQIKTIFILQGLFIGLVAVIFGLIAGLLVSYNVNFILHLIETVINRLLFMAGRTGVALLSGDGFYLNGIPTQIMAGDVIIIISIALSNCLLAAYLAAREASRLKPLEALRRG